ncbi:hypothetical protein HELRODRAFT_175131 [Helobdella robusta]|uniref:Uncharacterized protein n=1 Tax=Helobdella robusta TaxID=6412 RepID=T1F8W4_HELRO|nr:hypothetical protein HELRODRAFT_175131 [Helobdella robusta]ESO01102.1 hypothetical protein HELRODRAFT_175131 [Helobdella robusta]
MTSSTFSQSDSKATVAYLTARTDESKQEGRYELEMARSSTDSILQSFSSWPGTTFEKQQDIQDKMKSTSNSSSSSSSSSSIPLTSQSIFRSRHIFMAYLNGHRSKIQSWTYFCDEIHFYTDLIDVILTWVNRGESPLPLDSITGSVISFIPLMFGAPQGHDSSLTRERWSSVRYLLQSHSYLLSSLNYIGAEQSLCRAYHSLVCLTRRETLYYANFSFAGEAFFRMYRQSYPSLTDPRDDLPRNLNEEEVLFQPSGTSDTPPRSWRWYGPGLSREWRMAEHKLFFPTLFICRSELVSEMDYVVTAGGKATGTTSSDNEDVASVSSSSSIISSTSGSSSGGTFSKRNLNYKSDEISSAFDVDNNNVNKMYSSKKIEKLKSSQTSSHDSNKRQTTTTAAAAAANDPSVHAQQDISNYPCGFSRKNETKITDIQLITEHELSRVLIALKHSVDLTSQLSRQAEVTCTLLLTSTFFYLVVIHCIRCSCLVLKTARRRKRASKAHLLQKREVPTDSSAGSAPLLLVVRRDVAATTPKHDIVQQPQIEQEHRQQQYKQQSLFCDTTTLQQQQQQQQQMTYQQNQQSKHNSVGGVFEDEFVYNVLSSISSNTLTHRFNNSSSNNNNSSSNSSYQQQQRIILQQKTNSPKHRLPTANHLNKHVRMSDVTLPRQKNLQQQNPHLMQHFTLLSQQSQHATSTIPKLQQQQTTFTNNSFISDIQPHSGQQQPYPQSQKQQFQHIQQQQHALHQQQQQFQSQSTFNQLMLPISFSQQHYTNQTAYSTNSTTATKTLTSSGSSFMIPSINNNINSNSNNSNIHLINISTSNKIYSTSTTTTTTNPVTTTANIENSDINKPQSNNHNNNNNDINNGDNNDDNNNNNTTLGGFVGLKIATV